MYNRYIPQSDGTYRRSRIPEYRPEGNGQFPKPAPPPIHQENSSCQPKLQENPQPLPPKGRHVEGFLRQILPKDFDTGDLLVILLLLLMAGDSKENQNSALLTLALYLFM